MLAAVDVSIASVEHLGKIGNVNLSFPAHAGFFMLSAASVWLYTNQTHVCFVYGDENEVRRIL